MRFAGSTSDPCAERFTRSCRQVASPVQSFGTPFAVRCLPISQVGDSARYSLRNFDVSLISAFLRLPTCRNFVLVTSGLPGLSGVRD